LVWDTLYTILAVVTIYWVRQKKISRSEKMTVLNTFLESSLNFLSNDIKNTFKSSTVREKSSIKI